MRVKSGLSGGALHLRKNALIVCSPAQQRALATAAATVGFHVSVESGGALCGGGSGVADANDTLTGIAPFLDAGGKIHTLLLGEFFLAAVAHQSCPHHCFATFVAAAVRCGYIGGRRTWCLFGWWVVGDPTCWCVICVRTRPAHAQNQLTIIFIVPIFQLAAQTPQMQSNRKRFLTDESGVPKPAAQ